MQIGTIVEKCNKNDLQILLKYIERKAKSILLNHLIRYLSRYLMIQDYVYEL